MIEIPKRERVEVQLHDRTDQHNLLYLITSLASIKGDSISKNFRLYRVDPLGTLELIEKKDGEPSFEFLRGTEYDLEHPINE